MAGTGKSTRLRSAVQLLQLARLLAGSSEGVPMARLVKELGVERRTVHRMIAAGGAVRPRRARATAF